MTRLFIGAAGLASLVGLSALSFPGDARPTPGALQVPGCPVSPNMALEGRASPLDSASVHVAGEGLKVCYGAPSARGRTMIGGEDVPFGELWRTGANEATTFHTTAPVRVAGIALEPGSYAIYTIPGAEAWELFVSRSTDHWGLRITDEVRAQEVGSATLPRERPEDHVETLRLEFGSPEGDRVPLILEWETFRITIPVEVGSP